MTWRIGSLFSGIGGLELGLEWAGLGPVEWQVEVDPVARAVLAAHWPEVTRHDDVRSVGAATLAPVDLICGGFPCQDVSSAGKRAGLGGARSGLWFEFRRVVSELRPQWVVVENVASGAAAWVDEVTHGLEQLGYRVLSVPLSAADVGAPHERARVFLVAHAHCQGEPALPEHAEVAAPPHAPDADGDVLWHESWGGLGRTGPVRHSLESMARNGSLLPTLCARDAKGIGPSHTRSGSDLCRTVGGHLSPEFCEWLMGFPVDWTLPAREYVRSATRSFRSAPKSSAT